MYKLRRYEGSWGFLGASYIWGGRDAWVGIVIKHAFLEKFDKQPKWSVIWPGRAAKLSLQGLEGALDLMVAYFHTGNVVTEYDLFGVHPAARVTCTSFAALRSQLRLRLSNAVAPRNSVLTILFGDFNWVRTGSDRISTTTAAPSVRSDAGEESHFKNQISIPRGSQEMF